MSRPCFPVVPRRRGKKMGNDDEEQRAASRLAPLRHSKPLITRDTLGRCITSEGRKILSSSSFCFPFHPLRVLSIMSLFISPTIVLPFRLAFLPQRPPAFAHAARVAIVEKKLPPHRPCIVARNFSTGLRGLFFLSSRFYLGAQIAPASSWGVARNDERRVPAE